MDSERSYFVKNRKLEKGSVFAPRPQAWVGHRVTSKFQLSEELIRIIPFAGTLESGMGSRGDSPFLSLSKTQKNRSLPTQKSPECLCPEIENMNLTLSCSFHAIKLSSWPTFPHVKCEGSLQIRKKDMAFKSEPSMCV